MSDRASPSGPGRGVMVTMDNPSSHERASVHEAIEAAGARLMFLPPYGPDFNLVEKAFTHLDAIRKAGERTVSGLWSLIGRLVDLFQPRCVNYPAPAAMVRTDQNPL